MYVYDTDYLILLKLNQNKRTNIILKIKARNCIDTGIACAGCIFSPLDKH